MCRLQAGPEPLLDLWDQALRVSAIGALTQGEIELRRKNIFRNPDITLRFDRMAAGAFSLELRRPGEVTLLASLWQSETAVPGKAALEFSLASPKGEALPREIKVVFSGEDVAEIVAKAGSDRDGWTSYSVSCPANMPSRLRALTLDLKSAPAGTLLDRVLLQGADGSIVGFTDKPLKQWMAEAEETRKMRVQAAFQNGTETDFSGKLRQWFDKMWLGQELKEGNAELREMFQNEITRAKEKRADLWDLALGVRLVEIYYELGSKSTHSASVLEPETERLLLELIWERTKDKNDIGWATTSTWWLTGSENHDLNAKVINLISSRIFMNEPTYRSRLYPDAAHSPGYGYWFHERSEAAGYGPLAAAPWKASGQHTAAEHYEAWVTFFDRYLTERARRGFFLERASPVYMKWTLDFLHTLRRYGGDEGLKKKTSDFFDLIWADWAQEQIAGVRGGPKTRNRHTVGGYDSMTDMAKFLSGGPGTTDHIYAAMLLDDYAWPAVIWDLALDTRGRGNYEIASRGVGEEQTIRPRPIGTERTLMTDTDARFLKYSWVTPDYILGTQMDHPDAIQSHLSAVDRWHGMIVAGNPATRILPTGGMTADSGGKSEPDMAVMSFTVQSKNILILQQARRWAQINPDWFPSLPMYDKPIVFYTGEGWDEVNEEAGWVFFRRVNAYAAFREVLPKRKSEKVGVLSLPADLATVENPDLVEVADGKVNWTSDHKGIVLSDKFSLVILHAGCAAEHGSFANFQATVLASRLQLHKTVVPGNYWLTYQGAESGAKEIVFQANTPEIPLIGGQPVNYQPKQLFSGPFIQSDYGSGVIMLCKGSHKRLLDFNHPSSKAAAESVQN